MQGLFYFYQHQTEIFSLKFITHATAQTKTYISFNFAKAASISSVNTL